jgi:hypothetical protein
MTPTELLTPEQTAKILVIQPSSLAQMRWRGDKRLPWVKMGRTIRYKSTDVEHYIQSNTVG